MAKSIQPTVVVSRKLLRDFDRVARACGFAHRPPFFMHLIRDVLADPNPPEIPSSERPGNGVRVNVRIPVRMLPALDDVIERCGHTMRTRFLAGLMQHAVNTHGGGGNGR